MSGQVDLASKGINDVSSAKYYLEGNSISSCSPYEFKNMEKSVERIRKAIKEKEFKEEMHKKFHVG